MLREEAAASTEGQAKSALMICSSLTSFRDISRHPFKLRARQIHTGHEEPHLLSSSHVAAEGAANKARGPLKLLSVAVGKLHVCEYPSYKRF